MLIALVPVIGVDVSLEARSRSALKQLAERIAPRSRVTRDGREVLVETGELVPDDLLVLDGGGNGVASSNVADDWDEGYRSSQRP